MPYGQVHIQPSGLYQLVNTGGSWAFRGRKHQRDRVLFPWTPTGLVRKTAPDINHSATTLIKSTGGADFSVVPEIVGKCLCYWFEATRYPACDPALFELYIYRLQNLSPRCMLDYQTETDYIASSLA